MCLKQCRLCLRNKTLMVDIFTESDNKCALKEAIEDLLNIKILNTDEFPRTICGDCCSKVMGYKCFKAMCIKSKEILWRKSIENIIIKEAEESDIPVVIKNQPHPVANHTICSNAMTEDSHALVDFSLKKELCEDDTQERNHSDLLSDNVQPIRCNEIIKLDEAEEVVRDNDSMSSLSTLIRFDEEEESLHLHLTSSGSEISETNSIKEEVLNDFKASAVKEKSNGTYGYPIIECSVVVTRCDIDKYKPSLNKTALEQEEKGPPFPCSECWISFSSLAFLLKHKKYCHKKKRPETLHKEVKPNNEELNETSHNTNEKYKEMVSGSGPTKAKSKIVIEANPSRANCAKVLKLKEIHTNSMEKIMPSTRKSSWKDRVVKEKPIKGRKKEDENSSLDSVKLNSMDSTCDQNFNNKSKKYTRKFECNANKKSLSKKKLKLHSGIKPFSCQVCNRNFLTEFAKKKHESTHLDDEGFSCSKCKECFQSIRDFYQHMKVHHPILRPYKCTECDKTFSNGYQLRVHRRVHTGERPYKCNWCPQAFTHKGNLNTHNRIHTGERPFECMDCRKRFSNSTYLKKHLKAIHSKSVSSVASINNH